MEKLYSVNKEIFACVTNGTYSFLKHELIEFSAKGAWALFRVILQCKVIESCSVPWLQQLICPQSRVLFCHFTTEKEAGRPMKRWVYDVDEKVFRT